MNVMKLGFFLMIMFFSISQADAQQKPTTTNGTVTFHSKPEGSATQFLLYVYPNPFKESFYIRCRKQIKQVILLDDKGDEVDIEVTFLTNFVIVSAPNAEPGDYTVVINFQDGDTRNKPIKKG